VAATPPAASAAPRILGAPKLVIGEGVEEVRLFQALLRRVGVAGVAVEQYGGVDRLADYLATLRVRPGFAGLVSLGVTRDADDDAAGRFQSVCGHLRRNGFVAPPAHARVVDGSPRVGVFVLPDGVRPGMLEDLCWDAVAEGPARGCIDAFLACLDGAQLHPKPLAKARIHAWLSSRNVPDRRLGEAEQAGDVPFEHPAFDPVIRFLQSL